MSDEIDKDAELIGMNKEIWDKFKEMYCPKEVSEGKPTPETFTQAEFESIVGPIDDKEAEQRHRASMAKRWFFGYYRKCKDPEKRLKLIDEYNKLAKPRERE